MSLELFFRNFDVIAEAPNGVQKLREMILQLAVQGKLVKQDPNDEPASILLEWIQRKKEKFSKEKRIKKFELLTIKSNEISYELPNGWAWFRIGNIFSFEYGESLPASNRNDQGSFPVYGSNGIVGYHDKFLIEEPAIIIGRKGSCGALNLTIEPSWPTDVCYYVLPPKDMDIKFTYLLLASLHLGNLGKGIKPGLNRNEAYVLISALPPALEQHRIVVKVDELMKLCDELEEKQKKRREARITLNTSSLEHLTNARAPEEFDKHWNLISNNFSMLYDVPETVNELRQTILQLAVQGRLVKQDPNDEPASVLLEKIKLEKDKLIKAKKIKKSEPLSPITPEEIPYELPKGWLWVRLGGIGITQTGTTPPTSNRDYYGKDYPFIKPADISNSKIDYYNEGISELGIEVGRLVPSNSVMMVSIGGSIGKVGIVDRDCSCNQQINYITTLAGVVPKILYYTLQSPYFQNQVITQAPSTTLPILSKGKWDLIPIPISPQKEQNRIIIKIDQLMSLCDELEAKLRQSQAQNEHLVEAVVMKMVG